MLNISNKPIEDFDFNNYKSGKNIFSVSYFRQFNIFLLVFFLVFLIILFLPWTQNVFGSGFVTTLAPEQRPQSIQSPIPGRIEAWHVREGDIVNPGDTIVEISEIKSDYFDTELVLRTEQQLEAKEKSVMAYIEKVNALDAQIAALEQQRKLKVSQMQSKLAQVKLKVENDSLKQIVAFTDLSIAKTQLERVEALFVQGLKAKRELEEKQLNLREAEANYVSATNRLENAKNEVLITSAEVKFLEVSFRDKISKAKSEKATARSVQFETEGTVAKLKNTLANYTKREALKYVVAPQKGYINKAIKGGLGETFKAGDQLVSIMPFEYQVAIETYISPIDIPLIQLGESVRVEFDGWPAIVFSGWPTASFGTYGARVVAIENDISDNNFYRVLLAPDPEDNPWPDQVKIGSGARTIALLNEVPVWYELWRQLNGFPPDYYSTANKLKSKTVENESY